MLATETNTPAMQKRIHAAAWKRGYRQFNLHFEHGQWWMIVRQHGRMDDDETYSVVDAVSRGVDTFDFERV